MFGGAFTPIAIKPSRLGRPVLILCSIVTEKTGISMLIKVGLHHSNGGVLKITARLILAQAIGNCITMFPSPSSHLRI